MGGNGGGGSSSKRRTILLIAAAGCSLAGIASLYCFFYWARRKAKLRGDEGGGEAAAEHIDCLEPPKLKAALFRRPSEDAYTCLDNLDGSLVRPLINGIQQKIDATPLPLTVAVAGGTGSGKTTFAKAIYNALGEEHVTYITHDSYYKDLSHMHPEQRAKQNFDHPNALDTALLVEHIRRLKRGESVNIPVYDFATHTRTQETMLAVPRQVILLEGILIFAEPELVQQLDIKVYVDTEADIRLIRRLHRDVKERGRNVDSVISQYVKTVRPMHVEFVEPSKRFADVIVPTGINQVVLDMFLSRLQQEIGRTSRSSSEATHMAVERSVSTLLDG